MKNQPNHIIKFNPQRNLPDNYLECGNAQLAFDPSKQEWVWPGGKRISNIREARRNVEYLDRIISGELPMVISESGYVRL